MRRALVCLCMATALLLAGCRTSGPSGAIRLEPERGVRPRVGGCGQPRCALSGAVVRWVISWNHRTTGYYLYVDGRRRSDQARSPWRASGLDCGTTYTFGVRAHDERGAVSEEYKHRYETPPCGHPSVREYVAESSVGAGDGSSCADARSVTTLDSARSWTPGNVIGLCGTITSSVAALGSGARGAPITIYFEPGARLAQPACSPACLTLSHQKYIIVDGGSDGIIENTANGTGLKYQIASDGILADGCDNCTIKNLTIRNIYVHRGTSDAAAAAGNTGAVAASGQNLSVGDNTFDQMRGGVFVDEHDRSRDPNLRFYRNDIYDTDYGFWLAFDDTAGGPDLGPFLFYDNHVHDHRAWDTTADSFHHDGLMVYSSGSSATVIGAGVVVYGNRFDGASGADGTADVFLPGRAEGNAIGDESNVYIFDNVFDHSDNAPGNGTLVLHAGHVRVFNNTLIQPDSNANVGLDLNDGGTVALVNNLFDRGNVLVRDLDTSSVRLAAGSDHNFYVNGGANAFVCNGYYGFPSGFSRWRACTGADAHGRAYEGRFWLDTNGALPVASPAAGSGENLSSACNEPSNPWLRSVCQNIDGSARPRTGPWSAGAY